VAIALAFALGVFGCDQENEIGEGQLPSECFLEDSTKKIAPGTFKPCADNASCVPSEVIAIFDPKLIVRVAPCEDPSERCVPNEFIQGGMRYVPDTCLAFGLKEGRCLRSIIPEVKKLEAILTQSTCGQGELCSPCVHPLTDAETGACSITPCDPGPASPETGFIGCAEATGRCIPDLVFQALRAYALARGSGDVNLQQFLVPADCGDPLARCVSNQILSAGPFQTCNAGLFFGAGSCLDANLLNLTFGGSDISGSLVPDTCQGGHMCVPCNTARFFGTPTNAPGCEGAQSIIPAN